MHDDPGRPRGQRHPLVELDQLGERQHAGARGSPRSRSSPPCGRARTGAAPSRGSSPSVTPEYAGWHERALPLDEQQLSPRSSPFDDEPLGSAGEEVGDDGVDRDAPAGDRDPGLARSGRTRDASPRARAARSSSSATVIFPIAQSEPTVSTIRASTSRFAPVGTLRPVGRRRRSRSSTPCAARDSAQLGVVAR